MDEVELVVAHSERATLRVGDMIASLDHVCGSCLVLGLGVFPTLYGAGWGFWPGHSGPQCRRSRP